VVELCRVSDEISIRPKPRYFVVERKPYRMTPGLFRLGHDFGNGSADGLAFQRDAQFEHYRAEKTRVFAEHPERLQILTTPEAESLQKTAFAWMRARLLAEHGVDIPAPEGAPTESDFRTLALQIQEDFTLLRQTSDGDGIQVLLSVCFPSGWRPETLLGKTFLETHAPVPAFEEISSKKKQLVRAMVERGPYVRFVWSVTADERLDHHPDQAPRDAWTDGSVGYLRVERQITVPLPEERGSLFLIRTYLYSFAELSVDERALLSGALAALPESILAYKGLSEELPRLLRLLA
jgi:hypothetical protein